MTRARPDLLGALWARHLASPLPRAWLGPFGGFARRACRPLERVLLDGPPGAPRLRHWAQGRWKLRTADPLDLVEERARALGLPGLGWVAYEYAHLLEDFPAVAGAPSRWPLLAFTFFQEQEDLPLAGLPPAEWRAPVAPARTRSRGLEAERPPAEFRRGVARIRRWIEAGDCYQVNLVQAFHAPLATRDAPWLFARLRAGDAGVAGYQALFEERGRALVCDSPELFLERQGEHLRAQPIKGTVALPAGPLREARRRAAAWLLASEKDRAELAMIVDLLRNDLSRVCRPGSVQVGPWPAILALPSLLHTCARIRGRLRPGQGLAQIFRAAFPSGSITGCPRLRAMERITQLESAPRGPCLGALGRVEPTGDFLFNVAIRTALLEGGQLRLLAGGGITCDSRPAAEEAESRLKAERFRQVLAGPG
ncbi:MAG: chorismate-binding protein [Candidatus Delongbacteria bacterium]